MTIIVEDKKRIDDINLVCCSTFFELWSYVAFELLYRGQTYSKWKYVIQSSKEHVNLTRKCHNNKQTYQPMAPRVKDTGTNYETHIQVRLYNKISNQVSLPQWDSIQTRKNSKKYSKTCVKRPLKIDKTKILMTNGSLMKVKSIAEFCNTFDLH